MKLEALLQIPEGDEPDVKFDMIRPRAPATPSLTFVIGGVIILTDNPTFLSDLADVAKQAELELRRAQAHAQEIADDMGAEDEARARAYDAVLRAEERWDAETRDRR